MHLTYPALGISRIVVSINKRSPPLEAYKEVHAPASSCTSQMPSSTCTCIFQHFSNTSFSHHLLITSGCKVKEKSCNSPYLASGA